MLMSIYLHEEIYAILCCYGKLDDVVNKVLEEGMSGSFDIMNCPKLPPRTGARRFEVDVTNEEYIELLNLYPHNSTKISLRRLLYWFVENEMYEVLGWEQKNDYVDKRDMKRQKLLKRIRQQLESLLLITDDYEKVESAINIIKELEN